MEELNKLSFLELSILLSDVNESIVVLSRQLTSEGEKRKNIINEIAERLHIDESHEFLITQVARIVSKEMSNKP